MAKATPTKSIKAANPAADKPTNHSRKLPNTPHKLLAVVGVVSALLGSAVGGRGGMDMNRLQSRLEEIEWIVKKTPVQLNPSA
jgi:hypothetical protein